ncbi:SPOC domain-containing protein 1 isoform X2 [Alligator sinensis]|uniref:SPOC domain-containing protein 1 isoform X2 n=1 Tax=Alligator sinensis TaxID=38654 RepID=A0A3Q0G4B9_ALLSI|nr:SPOC domain-containing protein 1 isoform X2 [Alligator sinensis]
MENQSFHVTAWKDQVGGAPEGMEDIVAACLADKESQGECSKLAPEVNGEKGPSNIEGSSLGPGNCDKALPSEEALKEKASVAGGAFESPKISGVTGDDNKGRRAVPSETRFVNSPHLDQALDENNSRERQSAPEIPHLEALGKKEKLCNVENVEVRGPEEAATLQETRLPGSGGVRTEACLNWEGTTVKALLSPVEFAGPVSVFREQGTSRSPNGPGPEKEEEELFSIHTTAGNDPVAGERVGETPVSNEDGSDEHSADSLNGVRQNKVPLEREGEMAGEGFTCSRNSDVREIKGEDTDFKEEIITACEPLGSPKRMCGRNKISLMKPSYVVLKDLRDELKEKYRYSLMSSSGERLSLNTQKERETVFSDALQITLRGGLEESNTKKQNKVPNIKTGVQNKNSNNAKITEISRSEKGVTSTGSNGIDTEIHCAIEETQENGSLVEMDSSDYSDMCEQGIFAKLSLLEDRQKSSSVDVLRIPEVWGVQPDPSPLSSMTPEKEQEKHGKVVPIETLIKHWNKTDRELGKDNISDSSLTADSNRKGCDSRCSGGNRTSRISQSSRIVLAPENTVKGLRRKPMEETSADLSVNKTQRMLGDKKLRKACCLLPARSEEDRNIADREPICISSSSAAKYETPVKRELSRTTESHLAPVESPAQNSLEEAEEVFHEQPNAEEQKSCNQRNFKPSRESDDGSWFLSKIAEELEAACVDAEHKSVQQDSKRECFGPAEVALLSQSTEVSVSWRNKAKRCSPSGMQSNKYREIRSRAALFSPKQDKDEEISSVGKKVDPEPAQETRREGEEEDTLVHQLKGVQIVCYNMCGSVVRLLGAPSKAHKTSRLKRLLELEDSSAGKKMSKPNWGVTSSKAPRARKRARLEGSEHVSNEGSVDLQPAQKEIKDSDCNAVLPKKTKRLQKPYAAHMLWQRPLNSDDDNEKRRRRRARSLPKEASVSVPSLPLSAEQIRVKVIDSLRGMLQKRLEESLDLDVPEDTIMRLANNIEKEIFRLFLCVDQRYKNKYRSLLFNLRAPKNKLLFQQVVLGEVTPQRLVQMNSLEMAPKELAEWRAREHKQVLEVIEKQQQEAPMRCSTKLTHKGELEIHREMEENVTLEDLFESVLCMEMLPIPQSATESEKDTTDQHKSHLLDLDCHICTAEPGPNGEEGFNPSRNKSLSRKKEAELFRKLHSTRVCSARRSQHSENKRPVSSGILRKEPRLQKPLDKSTVLWEGSIQMFSIKEFLAKAYPVSGYGSHLVQALPAQIQSRGCTLPEDVWDFLDSIWPAEAKMSVIRFYPAVAQAMGTYNMLYTYLNNKQRYGIVDSKQMEMFLVPLPAFQPVPAKFHPQGGPGLEANHSSLLLGLILPKAAPGKAPASSLKPSLSTGTKRKKVTFKTDLVTECFAFAPQSPGSKQELAPAPLSKLLFSSECSPLISHGPELLTFENMFTFDVAAGDGLHEETSFGASASPCLQTRGEEANHYIQNGALHSLGHLCVHQEAGGEQQGVTRELQVVVAPDTSQTWDIGLLHPWSCCPDEEGGSAAFDANMCAVPQLSIMFYPVQSDSHESSAVLHLQNPVATGDSHPGGPIEEALSLIHQLEALVQQNSQLQNQTFPFPSVDGAPQIAGGSTFPPAQHGSSCAPSSE